VKFANDIAYEWQFLRRDFQRLDPDRRAKVPGFEKNLNKLWEYFYFGYVTEPLPEEVLRELPPLGNGQRIAKIMQARGFTTQAQLMIILLGLMEKFIQ
jgi:hypothetical protein